MDVQMADVQMADVQCDLQPRRERVTYRAALQNGQPMQIDLATPRAGQVDPQERAEAPNPAAVFTWSEEKLLELSTSLPNADYQAPAAGPEAKDVHCTQEAVATSHAVPSPMDQAT